MSELLASRLAPVKPSASAWVSQAARKLRQEGKDIIDLGLGEPDFATPAHIIDAAHKAALDGQTKYPPNDGTAELKRAVQTKFKRDNNLDFSANEILISNGAKQVIFNALMATLEPQSQVLLCAPYFGQYQDMVAVVGGQSLSLRCEKENDFLLSPKALEDVINADTKWLILNSPSNPAGATYSKKQLQALGRVLEKHRHVLVMADEIYEHILFDDQEFTSFASANPQLRERTLVVNGVSKAYAMTGWRIGFGAGPAALIGAMNTVQSQISSGACSIAQAAAAEALSGPQDCVKDFCRAFQSRRDLVVEAINAIPGLELKTPRGAFYAFVACDDLIGSYTPDGQHISNDIQFTEYLLNEAGIAAVPGSAYGISPFFRLSTATSETVLTTAMARIEAAVAKLKR